MYSLRAVLAQAQAAGTAIGHFNVADLVLLKAVIASARELKAPVPARLSARDARGPFRERPPVHDHHNSASRCPDRGGG